MAKISSIKKQKTAVRIVNQCGFLTDSWEKERMQNALLASFQWAENTSTHVDSDAPYSIVNQTND